MTAEDAGFAVGDVFKNKYGWKITIEDVDGSYIHIKETVDDKLNDSEGVMVSVPRLYEHLKNNNFTKIKSSVSKKIMSAISEQQNRFNYAYNDWYGHFAMNKDRIPQYLEGVKWFDDNSNSEFVRIMYQKYNIYPVGDREKSAFYNALKQLGEITSSRQINSSITKEQYFNIVKNHNATHASTPEFRAEELKIVQEFPVGTKIAFKQDNSWHDVYTIYEKVDNNSWKYNTYIDGQKANSDYMFDDDRVRIEVSGEFNGGAYPVGYVSGYGSITNSCLIKSGYEEQEYHQGYNDAVDGKEPVMPNSKEYMRGYKDGKDSENYPEDYTPGNIDITASKTIKSSRQYDDVEKQILFDNIVGGADEVFFEWYEDKYGDIPWDNMNSIPKDRIVEFVNENPDVQNEMEDEIGTMYEDYSAGNTLDKNVNDFLYNSKTPVKSGLYVPEVPEDNVAKSISEHLNEYISSDSFAESGAFDDYIVDKLIEKGFSNDEIEFGWHDPKVKAARDEISRNYDMDDYVSWCEKLIKGDKSRYMWYQDWLRANNYPSEYDKPLAERYSFDPANNTYPGPKQ